ncbi:MAG: hypothetical protein ACREIA_03830 [Opitutaceae bacterium]
MDLILDPAGTRRVIEIAQLAPDFLITTDVIEHPPGEAEIVFRVDGHERRWMVRLPDGLGKTSKTARILKAG